jgi:SWI/SNF related-matrix-associated actin-dependent regulator of chromatin subfamily C
VLDPKTGLANLVFDLHILSIFLISISGWFQWGEIHETEKQALPEFFEGVSTTKNPRVYKEYRDFIINKYREDTSKQLTFTEVRKELIGDVSLLQKLFSFLEKWGLINFSVAVKPSQRQDQAVETKVLIEEGAPHGLRVLLAPTVAVPQGKTLGEKKLIGGENGLQLPPLTSYSDVYDEWDPRKGSLCGLCGGQCFGGQYKKMEVLGFYSF